MVAMPSPILLPVGKASAFVPHPTGHEGTSAGSSPLSPPVGEAVASERPPSVEGALIPYRLPEGPLEWSSRDEGGDARFVLNDSREDKVWQHVGRQGLKAQEVLASAKIRLALVLKEVERAEKLVTSGLHPAIGVRFFASSLFFPARRCLVVTPFRFPGVREHLKEEVVFPTG
jgi:hypothetical protein